MFRRSPLRSINARFLGDDSARLHALTTHPLALYDDAGGKKDEPSAELLEFRALIKELRGPDGKGLTDREERLMKENFKVRQRARKAEDALAASKPADGSRVLTKDEATAFDAYSKIGVKPEELTTALSEREQLKREKAQGEADGTVGGIAEALGLNPRALKRLAKSEGLTLLTKTVKVKDDETGKMVDEEVVYVRKSGGKADGSEDVELDAMIEDLDDDDRELLYAGGDGSLSRRSAGAGDDEGESPYQGETRRRARGEQSQDEERGTRFPRQSTREPNGAGTRRKAFEAEVARKRGSGMYGP